MATDGKKLNQLPELTTLSDATMLYAVDGGEDYHVNFETIKDETVPEVFTPTTDGLVPHPNSGNGGKVLRGDGTWQGTFDSSNDGLVPKLGTNDKDKVLRGDGAWVANDKLIGTGSGSLVTFDAIEAPMPSLKVSVEAKQDLHGYDKPWVGGAGKNKCPMTVDNIKALNTTGTWSGNSYTQTGVTFTIQTDADGNVVGIATSGTSSNYIYFTLTYVDAEIGMIINGAPTGGDRYKWFQAIDTTSDFDYGNGATISKSVTNKKFMIVVANGVNMSNKTFYPMIRLATESDATFAPYSNICPISGWSEVNVSDVGKNLLDGTTFTRSNKSGQSNVNWARWDEFIPCIQSSYTLSCGFNATLYALNVDLYDKNQVLLEALDLGQFSANGKAFSVENQNAKYMKISIYNNTSMESYDFSHAQLELGSTATEYVPYVEPNLYTISLPQTVYGGEVDVVNGELKITDGYIASYNGETLPSTWISSMDVYAEGTTPTTGAEVCYELANPIIINLTPTLIKSLEGTNNLSVDCGEIIEVEYQRSITEAINALEAGGGYSETSLWSSSSGVYTGSLDLSDSIENYNALMFKVSNAQGWANFAYIPTSALASNNAKAGIGGGMQSAVWWFQFTRTDATHITINNNSSTGDKLYQIVGVKY